MQRQRKKTLTSSSARHQGITCGVTVSRQKARREFVGRPGVEVLIAGSVWNEEHERISRCKGAAGDTGCASPPGRY